MGVEPSHNQPHSGDNTPLEGSLPRLNADQTLELRAINQKISEAAGNNEAALCNLLRALKHLTNKYPDTSYHAVLQVAVNLCISHRAPIAYALEGMWSLLQHKVPLDKASPEHAIHLGALCVDVRNELGPFDHFLKGEEKRACGLIKRGLSPVNFRLYAELVRQCFKLVPIVDAPEVTQELWEVFIKLEKLHPRPPMVRLLTRTLREMVATEFSRDIPEFIEDFCLAYEKTRVSKNLRASWESLETAVIELSKNKLPIANVVKAYMRIVSEDGPVEVANLLLKLVNHYLPIEGSEMRLGELATSLVLIKDSPAARSLDPAISGFLANGTGRTSLQISNFLAAQIAGSAAIELITKPDAKDRLNALERVANAVGLKAAQLMQNPNSDDEYRQYQRRIDISMPDVLLIMNSFGRRQIIRDRAEDLPKGPAPTLPMLLIPPVYRAVMANQRLVDTFDGFGSLTYDARRTPDSVPAFLARFGASLGQCKLIRATSREHFPGPGFAIYGLETDRILYADPNKRDDPFHLYRRAWPKYADEIGDLASAQFTLNRGMITITCPDMAKYSLRHPANGNNPVQYSLVIFNSHFGNPLRLKAYLVPTQLVRKIYKGTTISDSNPGHHINDALPNPEAFLADPEFGKFVIDLSPLKVLTHGILSDECKMWHAYLERLDKHNAEVKAWDASVARDRRVISTNFSEEIRLQHQFTELQEMYTQMTSQGVDQKDQELWQLVNRHCNLFDLFKISLSNYRRGFTQARELGGNEPDAQEPELVIDEGAEDLFMNRSALMMLEESYRWHAQRKDGVTDREKFPLLFIGDALTYSSLPTATEYLDTYDMVIHIGDKSIPLTEDEMTMDDQIFWVSTFMPRAADGDGKIRDLRFISRHTVGIE